MWGWGAERVVEQLQARTAKRVSLGLCVVSLALHGLLHAAYSPDSCTWLLSRGRYKGDHEWQPYGCMLHRYTHTDTRHCFRYLAFWGRYNHFVFVGDDRIRQLYYSFISHYFCMISSDSFLIRIVFLQVMSE